QHDRAGGQRNDDGEDGKMMQQETQDSDSRPSTWSVPVRPREASRTTRNNAVVAKPMTMAVSASACGSGSAYQEGSWAAAGSTTGGRPEASRPMPKMKRFTA